MRATPPQHTLPHTPSLSSNHTHTRLGSTSRCPSHTQPKILWSKGYLKLGCKCLNLRPVNPNNRTNTRLMDEDVVGRSKVTLSWRTAWCWLNTLHGEVMTMVAFGYITNIHEDKHTECTVEGFLQSPNIPTCQSDMWQSNASGPTGSLVHARGQKKEATFWVKLKWCHKSNLFTIDLRGQMSPPLPTAARP